MAETDRLVLFGVMFGCLSLWLSCEQFFCAFMAYVPLAIC